MMRSALATRFNLTPDDIHPAERIADAIIECFDETGQCTIEILKTKHEDFKSDAFLNRYWGEACRIVQLKRPRSC